MLTVNREKKKRIFFVIWRDYYNEAAKQEAKKGVASPFKFQFYYWWLIRLFFLRRIKYYRDRKHSRNRNDGGRDFSLVTVTRANTCFSGLACREGHLHFEEIFTENSQVSHRNARLAGTQLCSALLWELLCIRDSVGKRLRRPVYVFHIDDAHKLRTWEDIATPKKYLVLCHSQNLPCLSTIEKGCHFCRYPSSVPSISLWWHSSPQCNPKHRVLAFSTLPY
jgi:hypothetical protein